MPYKFLFGSGLSCPFLSTLGNVEQWLTELSTTDKDSPTTRNAIETNILVKYVENVMFPCIEDLDEEQKGHGKTKFYSNTPNSFKYGIKL